MFRESPMRHVTAVLGAVTVTEAVPVATVTLPDEVDAVLPAASRALTPMRPVVVTGPGAVQVQLWTDPARPVQPGTGLKDAPPLDENATSCEVTATLSEDVQRMTYGVPVKRRSPPVGWTSATAGGVASVTTTGSSLEVCGEPHEGVVVSTRR
jgi:hypothetical protein